MFIEVDFWWYFSHTYGSSLPSTTLTEVTHLLRKSPSTTRVTYGSQFKLRKLTFSINGLRKSTSDCVIFMLFIVVYGSPLPKFILVYGSPLPSSCGLQKSTFGIKSLAEVDFRFMVYVSGIDTTDLYSNQLIDAYTYRCMANMTATTQKMKNYEGILLHMLM